MSAIIMLLSIAVKATLVLALAAIIERTLLRSRASAAARHLLWSCSLAALVLLPAATVLLPGWRVPIPAALASARWTSDPVAPSSRPTVERDRASAVLTEAPTAIATSPAAPQPQARVRHVPVSSWPHLRASDVLFGTYVAGVLLLLARICAEQRAMRRLRRTATPVRDAEWIALRDSCVTSLRVRRRVALLESVESGMPLTGGIVRPFVLLPAGSITWPVARRRAVLLHELAHVARHDCLTQTIAALACAIYWPHPGVWWVAARMRLERELACDDQVLARGIRPRDYAGHLLAIARGHRTAPALGGLAMGMAATSHLETRLRALIDGHRRRSTLGRRAATVEALLTMLLLVPLAAARPIAAGGLHPHGASGALSSSAASRSIRAAVPAPVQDDASSGDWKMRLAARDEAPDEITERPAMHVSLWAPGLNTFYVPLRQLNGLTDEQIAASDAPVHFALRRDAGTFTFDGAFQNGRGSGQFKLVIDPAFADALVRRGMERPTAAQQLSMARHGIGFDFLDALAENGYAQPSTAALLSAGVNGGNARYVRGMAALGYRLGTLDALMHLLEEGVDPAVIRGLADAGYSNLSPHDLVMLQNNALDTVAIRRMNAAAGHRLTVRELVQQHLRAGSDAADAPESPGGATAPASRDGMDAPVRASSTPLAGRWVLTGTTGHPLNLELQWNDNTQWRRWIDPSQLRGLGPDAVTSASATPVTFRIDQDAGSFEFRGVAGAGSGSGDFQFRPNRGFVATLHALGLGTGGEITDHQLKNLAFGGIGAAEIRDFRKLGVSPLRLEDVLDLAVFQVPPSYVQAMRSLGVRDLVRASDIIDLYRSGVTAEYVQALDALGYRGVSSHQLMELREERVTPEFVRSMQQGGHGGATLDDMVALRHREESPRQ